jgi:hypothetical protein
MIIPGVLGPACKRAGTGVEKNFLEVTNFGNSWKKAL